MKYSDRHDGWYFSVVYETGNEDYSINHCRIC